MDCVELDQLKEELQMELPEQFRRWLLDYPIEDPKQCHITMPNSRRDVVANNTPRRLGADGAPLLMIGADGFGNYYFMRPGRDETAIYYYDHEEPGMYPDRLETLEELEPEEFLGILSEIDFHYEEDMRMESEAEEE